jgi:predicted transcriptional regulator
VIRASGLDILVALLEHGAPMTKSGLTAELGVRSTSINRAIVRLTERGLVEPAGLYTNPGTGRNALTFGPGPLMRAWAQKQANE